MNQRILFSILLALFSQIAFGQSFAGVNTASLTTKGTETTTVLSSNQLVGRYLTEQNKLTFLIKTQTFSFNADQTGQAYLNEVLLMQSNPLMAISLDLDLATFSNQEEADVNGVITFNDQELAFQTKVKVEQSSESIQLSTTLDLDLSQLGLFVPNDNKTFSSNLIQFTIDQASLQKR